MTKLGVEVGITAFAAAVAEVVPKAKNASTEPVLHMKYCSQFCPDVLRHWTGVGAVVAAVKVIVGP